MPADLAWSAASASITVLPIPASPVTSRTWLDGGTGFTSARSRANPASRPMMGASSCSGRPSGPGMCLSSRRARPSTPFLAKTATAPSACPQRANAVRQTAREPSERTRSWCCVKSPSPRPWWARGREHGAREARRHAAAASGRETKGPAGAAASGGISVTRSQPTRCDIGARGTAPMSHRVGTGQRGPGRRAGRRPIICLRGSLNG